MDVGILKKTRLQHAKPSMLTTARAKNTARPTINQPKSLANPGANCPARQLTLRASDTRYRRKTKTFSLELRGQIKAYA
tara:strand:- start:359 stop:595 length:237 start_codon:yes stop_codon:yes gene_type:complete